MYSERKSNNLKGYLVKTQSGIKLGYVFDTEADLCGHLKNIIVKKRFLKFYFGESIKIHRSQIIQILGKKIIVKDAYELLKENKVQTAGSSQTA